MSTQPGPGDTAIADERSRLVNIAYRLLGSLAEAEDAVQETYARWYALPAARRDAIESPAGWLTTVVSRVCLDLLGSARARRERYVGEWLPEPLPGPPPLSGSARPADPADRVTLDESVAMAFLVVLESMTPAERVAFVLHDVFRYPFAEVAAITGRTPAACRQLASAARRRVRDSPAIEGTTPAARQASLVRDFRRAWEAGDIRALVGLLDPAVVLTSDGGGLVPAALHPVEGAGRVAAYLVGLTDRADRVDGADRAGQGPGGREISERMVNGQPGLVAKQDGVTVTVLAFGLAGDRIGRIWAVRNPGKLRPWTAG